jgi:lipopolysaccharide export LptBFGC system permease protein LptF
VEVSQKSLHGLNKLENAYKSANRWEFERWILVVTLLSIMFAVLFIGVLAICKKSRGAIVAFSGLGIVVFVLAWTIFSVLFPISVVSTCFINLYKLSSGVR